MSDVSPKKLTIPDLPDEICLEIFKCCDTKTIFKVKATSYYWKETLSSYEFASEVSKKWLTKGCSIVSHYGFTNKPNSSSDWAMNMDAIYGEAHKINLPMVIGEQGSFRIVGIENGIFCFRYSIEGEISYLLAWNPADRSTKVIPDPPKHFCKRCSFLYTFGYFPDSVHYGIIHLFKKKPSHKTWSLTMYSSLEQNWGPTLTCPNYVRNLDPNYVSLDGVIYWMKWREDGDKSPPYIVSFSMLNFNFRQIIILDEVSTNYLGLLIHAGKLCVGATNYDQETYLSNIWEITNIEESPVWNKLFTYNGHGNPYLPAIFIDDDIIQVLERYYQIPEEPTMKFTIFHITRLKPMEQLRYSLKWIEYDDFVRLRSFFTYFESAFPVAG
ncbi:hypothetical protein PIB30_040127 [Stylosanthes scabra]|uniref:F-box domain-containing protein n=1 Tax=Stylosanthes scabra TaxID=79078 RepID=A0ABU6TEA2_9FABA|nr:hypothetical protein [Stylosanthes scabra]